MNEATATINNSVMTKERILENAFLKIRPATDDDAIKIKYLDLEIVPCVKDGDLVAIAKEGFFEGCGIDYDEFFKRAVENIEKDAETFNLGSMFGNASPTMPTVISNKSCCLGAIALIFPDILDKVCEERGCEKLVIQPSSIHEILCHTDGFIPYDELNALVKAVNADSWVMKPEEVLSDHIYFYDKATRKVTY